MGLIELELQTQRCYHGLGLNKPLFLQRCLQRLLSFFLKCFAHSPALLGFYSAGIKYFKLEKINVCGQAITSQNKSIGYPSLKKT